MINFGFFLVITGRAVFNTTCRVISQKTELILQCSDYLIVRQSVQRSFSESAVVGEPWQQAWRKPGSQRCIIATLYTTNFLRSSTVCGLNKNNLQTDFSISKVNYSALPFSVMFFTDAFNLLVDKASLNKPIQRIHRQLIEKAVYLSVTCGA